MSIGPSNILNDDKYMAVLSQSAANNAAAAVSDATDDELEQSANCFALFDEDRDGELSPAEFSELLRVVHLAEGDPPSTEAQAAAVFSRADLNRNGRIDFNEFLRFHATYISVQLADLRRVKAKGGAAG